MIARGALLVCLIALLSFRPVWAQSCGAAATVASFGVYQPLSPANTTTTATITVTCHPGRSTARIDYELGLTAGTGGSFGMRSMAGPTTRLRYKFYRDVDHRQVWGDGTGGSFIVSDVLAVGFIRPETRSYTVYAGIAAHQNVGSGQYSDAIILLVSY